MFDIEFYLHGHWAIFKPQRNLSNSVQKKKRKKRKEINKSEIKDQGSGISRSRLK